MIGQRKDIDELLMRRATEGLTEAEERRLSRLIQEHGLSDSDDLNLAAAAAANAFGQRQAGGIPEVPALLRARLKRDAATHFATQRVETRQRRWAWGLAASLLVGLFAFQVLETRTSQDHASAREYLLAEVADTIAIPWAPSEFPEYAAVTGDVVWSDARQQGYLLLAGMPANDPDTAQYQLWVVDPERDANPVDGGVFDIPAGGQPALIPIDAKLAVDQPVAFAITLEQPGGVVVSGGPLLVVASRT